MEVPGGGGQVLFFVSIFTPGGHGNIGGGSYPENKQKKQLVVHTHKGCRTRDAYILEQHFRRFMIFLPLIMLVALRDPQKSRLRKCGEMHPPPGGTLWKIGTPGGYLLLSKKQKPIPPAGQQRIHGARPKKWGRGEHDGSDDYGMRKQKQKNHDDKTSVPCS